MFEPFVMVAMCDCRFDTKTHKKTCAPFLRAFANGCNGIRLVGDFDHSGNPYHPTGEVSSDAKCCDCCDNETKKRTHVCYDLACLIRREERNGGLENIQLADGNGALGGVIRFSPPANSVQMIVDTFNSVAYLGFTTWSASADQPGFLCLEVPDKGLIPGAASGCRFRRFRSTLDNGGMSISVSNSGYGAYGSTQDNLTAGAPGVLPSAIVNSNTHYYCKLNLHHASNGNVTVAEPYVSSVLQPKNLFRLEFPDNSTAMYVPSYPSSTWTNVWPAGGPLNAANRSTWATQLEKWAAYVIGTALPYGSAKAYAQWIAPPVQSGNVQVFRGALVVDVPCSVTLNNLYGVQVNNIELNADGTFAFNAGSHRRTFAEEIGAGQYTSIPYVDGKGGSISWNAGCEVAGPFPNGASGDMSTE